MNKRRKLFSGVVFAFALMFTLASGAGYISQASGITTEGLADETEPFTNETEPSTDETEPSTDETEPSTDETEPSTEETEPSTDETEPSTEETEPSTEETEPSTDETEPSTEETESSTEAPEEEYTSITTAEELKAIASNADGKYILMNDIDLSQTAWSSIESFSGILNGNGHTIKGLSAPLIASMTGGSIYNLTLSDVNISAAESVGALVKTLSSGAEKCVITNINVSGTITGTDAVGGVIGVVNVSDNQLEISSCYNTANITGVNEVGGIVGRLVCSSSAAAAELDVKSAANSGTIKGTSKVGGVVGYVSLADAVSSYDARVSLTESYNVGVIDCINTYAGGLAGYI